MKADSDTAWSAPKKAPIRGVARSTARSVDMMLTSATAAPPPSPMRKLHFRPISIREEPGRQRSDRRGDPADEEPKADELDAESHGQEVEVEQDLPGSVDEVHADDVGEIEAGVPVEQPDGFEVAREATELNCLARTFWGHGSPLDLLPNSPPVRM